MACQLPFSLVLTVLTLVCSLVPGGLIWFFMHDTLMDSVNSMSGASNSSVEALTNTMQDLLNAASLEHLGAEITEATNVMTSIDVLLQNHNLAARSFQARPGLADELYAEFFPTLFSDIVSHQLFSFILVQGAYIRPGDEFGPRSFWVSTQAFYYDAWTVPNTTLYTRTIYGTTLDIGTDGNYTLVSYLPNQTTGQKVLKLGERRIPVARPGILTESSWYQDVVFNQYNALAEVMYSTQSIVGQNNTYVSMTLGLSTQTISDDMRSRLINNTDDRQFIFFRQPHGHLLGATHGKFYSTSDVDYRYRNPFGPSPNMSQVYAYTCLNSNDPIIYQACYNLYTSAKGNWVDIPEGHQEMVLQGMRFWVAVGHRDTGINCTVVALKPRAALMQTIDAQMAATEDEVDRTKNRTYIILGVSFSVSAAMSLALGLWIAWKLRSMGQEMRRVGKLHFGKKQQVKRSVFREFNAVQNAFFQMETGLEAFFNLVSVPGGDSKSSAGSSCRFATEHVAFVYVNVQGFDAVCATYPTALFSAVFNEYQNVVDRCVEKTRGMVHYYIGDRFLAMWNPVLSRGRHLTDALECILKLQHEVFMAHRIWTEGGGPALKFRAGVHCGQCLVKLTQTEQPICVGEAVKVAAQLEALNKHFGTVLCASDEVFSLAKEGFHFRGLWAGGMPPAKVPAVFEVVAPKRDSSLPGMPSQHDSDNSLIHQYEPSPSLPGDVPEASDSVVYHWELFPEQAVIEHCER
eukprot:EG_transcript_4577